MKKHLFLIVLVCTLLVGCKPDPVLPTVKTLDVTEITETSALCMGDITDNGNATITAKGFCWSTEQNPTLENGFTTEADYRRDEPVPPFYATITELLANTTYYVRAYATNSEGTAYGENISFVTLEENDDDDDNNGGDDNGGDDNGGDDNGGDDNGGDDNGGDDEIVVELPTITTVTVSEITIHSAMVSAEVLADGGADVIEYGFYWNKANAGNDEPTEPTRVKVGEGLGVFTHTLSGLLEETKYYVCAYAINSAGEIVSDGIYFTTLKDNNGGDDNTEYAYVDLGLPSGTLWAEHNVGALFPEGYGDHFAYGEIEPKANYTSDNCSSYQQDLGEISGNPMFDAATANWGDDWRMPTLEEMFELTQECTWTWTEVNGVSGYKVTSKTNGNYIFLPASGFRVYGDLIDQNLYGYYWTSTPYEEEGTTPTFTKACFLDMCSYQVYCNWSLRRNGMTIRPVRN